MSRVVVPSVFATNEKDYKKRFDIAKTLSRRIHIDVMDGNFVKSKSPPLHSFYGLGKNNEIDVHLMVKKPEEYLEEMKRVNARRVYLHIESKKTNDLLSTIKLYKDSGFVVGIAINPETSTDSLIPFVFHVSGCLVMSVKPGKEGQAFIVGTYNKLREVFKHMQGKEIAVDGGIHEEVIMNLKNANVNVLVSGSSVFSVGNPRNAFEHLEALFR